MGKRHIVLWTCSIVLALAACGDDKKKPPVQEEVPPSVLARPSRSTTIDVSPDDAFLAEVNPDNGRVSLFDIKTTGSEVKIGSFFTSTRTLDGRAEPSSVVIHPDTSKNVVLFVANRGLGTISKITIVGVDATVEEAEAGGEIVGLALSPTGRYLVSTDWSSGRAKIWTTSSLSVAAEVNVGSNPYAVAITNDKDTDDADEKVYITQFYADVGEEKNDTGRVGIVRVFDIATALAGNVTPAVIELPALTECFNHAKFADPNAADSFDGCFPNQLYAITLHTTGATTNAYVLSVGAQPQGPPKAERNMQALVHVINTGTNAVSAKFNLNELIRIQQVNTSENKRSFCNVAMGLSFVENPDSITGYVACHANDMVLRFTANAAFSTINVGSNRNFNINLNTGTPPAVVGQNTMGVALRHASGDFRAYAANLISRDLSIIDLANQSVERTLLSDTHPPEGGPQALFDAWKGKRFFNTGTGIWSREGLGSCVGCHPAGLTDNVTWAFAAGPRQTIALDGQFASNDRTDMRPLNWTAIFDESDDFEGNTRGVSGGLGAILKDATTRVAGTNGADFVGVVVENGTTLENHQALNGSTRFISKTTGICTNANTCPDWRQIDTYIQTIRSPRGSKSQAQADIDAGRAIFDSLNCEGCHAGPKWTVSRLPYNPDLFSGDLANGNRVFEANRLTSVAMDKSTYVASSQLPATTLSSSDTFFIVGDDSGDLLPGETSVAAGSPALKRVACALRSVGTYGVNGNGGAEDRNGRANNTRGQGVRGFNIPSLLNIAGGAPYMHNGSARNLDDVLNLDIFSAHLTAGNANAAGELSSAETKRKLKAFLLSIDETTTIFNVAAAADLCGTYTAP